MNASSASAASSSSDPAGPQLTGPGRVVGPAWFARTVLAPMTKRLNPLIVRRAGQPGFAMAAQIRHVGRRSGRSYVTPVTVRRDGASVVIGLTFGSQSDWARNVLAAGRCSMLIDGIEYEATSPQVVDTAEAGPFIRSAYSGFERFMLRRVLGISQLMRLAVTPAASDSAPGPVVLPQ
jgi:deazaflavin-dependent oxidoreductase (nitroreductase family)